jgi:antitoxin component of MazEF toxin-antitoxin module
MAHVSKVQMWGRNKAVTVPKALAKALNWHVGDLITLNVVNGVLVVQAFEPPKVPNVTGVQQPTGVAE